MVTISFKMLTGILEIDEGDILIDNYSITKNPLEAKKRFGYEKEFLDIQRGQKPFL